MRENDIRGNKMPQSSPQDIDTVNATPIKNPINREKKSVQLKTKIDELKESGEEENSKEEEQEEENVSSTIIPKPLVGTTTLHTQQRCQVQLNQPISQLSKQYAKYCNYMKDNTLQFEEYIFAHTLRSIRYFEYKHSQLLYNIQCGSNDKGQEEKRFKLFGPLTILCTWYNTDIVWNLLQKVLQNDKINTTTNTNKTNNNIINKKKLTSILGKRWSKFVYTLNDAAPQVEYTTVVDTPTNTEDTITINNNDINTKEIFISYKHLQLYIEKQYSSSIYEKLHHIDPRDIISNISIENILSQKRMQRIIFLPITSILEIFKPSIQKKIELVSQDNAHYDTMINTPIDNDSNIISTMTDTIINKKIKTNIDLLSPTKSTVVPSRSILTPRSMPAMSEGIKQDAIDTAVDIQQEQQKQQEEQQQQQQQQQQKQHQSKNTKEYFTKLEQIYLYTQVLCIKYHCTHVMEQATISGTQILTTTHQIFKPAILKCTVLPLGQISSVRIATFTSRFARTSSRMRNIVIEYYDKKHMSKVATNTSPTPTTTPTTTTATTANNNSTISSNNNNNTISINNSNNSDSTNTTSIRNENKWCSQLILGYSSTDSSNYNDEFEIFFYTILDVLTFYRLYHLSNESLEKYNIKQISSTSVIQTSLYNNTNIDTTVPLTLDTLQPNPKTLKILLKLNNSSTYRGIYIQVQQEELITSQQRMEAFEKLQINSIQLSLFTLLSQKITKPFIVNLQTIETRGIEMLLYIQNLVDSSKHTRLYSQDLEQVYQQLPSSYTFIDACKYLYIGSYRYIKGEMINYTTTTTTNDIINKNFINNKIQDIGLLECDPNISNTLSDIQNKKDILLDPIDNKLNMNLYHKVAFSRPFSFSQLRRDVMIARTIMDPFLLPWEIVLRQKEWKSPLVSSFTMIFQQNICYRDMVSYIPGLISGMLAFQILLQYWDPWFQEYYIMSWAFESVTPERQIALKQYEKYKMYQTKAPTKNIETKNKIQRSLSHTQPNYTKELNESITNFENTSNINEETNNKYDMQEDSNDEQNSISYMTENSHIQSSDSDIAVSDIEAILSEDVYANVDDIESKSSIKDIKKNSNTSSRNTIDSDSTNDSIYDNDFNTTNQKGIRIIHTITNQRGTYNSALTWFKGIHKRLVAMEVIFMKMNGLLRWHTPSASRRLVIVLCIVSFLMLLCPFRYLFAISVIKFFSSPLISSSSPSFIQKLLEETELHPDDEYLFEWNAQNLFKKIQKRKKNLIITSNKEDIKSKITEDIKTPQFSVQPNARSGTTMLNRIKGSRLFNRFHGIS